MQAGAQKIPVGQIIAVLAEEGDDLSSITIPETTSPAAPEQSKQQPEEEPREQKAAEQKAREQPRDERRHHEHKEIKHSKPLFPSVSRLCVAIFALGTWGANVSFVRLQESSLSTDEISKLKGTGRHGMLTKGDVLHALGKVKNRYGSAEKYNVDVMGPSGKRLSERGVAKEVEKKVVLDGPALRRLVVGGMAKATQPAHPIIHHGSSKKKEKKKYGFQS